VNNIAVVSAILYNAQGQVLLQLRDDKPKLLFPSHWTLFGGSAEPDETPEQAMRRELLEEIEIEPPLTFWKAYVCPFRTKPGELRVDQYVYFAEINTPTHEMTLHEGQAMRYFGREELEALQIGYGFHPLILEFWESRVYENQHTNGR
jgi:8-oxo-dGTP diphosphatase